MFINLCDHSKESQLCDQSKGSFEYGILVFFILLVNDVTLPYLKLFKLVLMFESAPKV